MDEISKYTQKINSIALNAFSELDKTRQELSDLRQINITLKQKLASPVYSHEDDELTTTKLELSGLRQLNLILNDRNSRLAAEVNSLKLQIKNYVCPKCQDNIPAGPSDGTKNTPASNSKVSDVVVCGMDISHPEVGDALNSLSLLKPTDFESQYTDDSQIDTTNELPRGAIFPVRQDEDVLLLPEEPNRAINDILDFNYGSNRGESPRNKQSQQHSNSLFVPESPECKKIIVRTDKTVVPETVRYQDSFCQFVNELTPKKKSRPGMPSTPENIEGNRTSVVRVAEISKLMPATRSNLDATSSQIISPSQRSSNLSQILSPNRDIFSPQKTKPRKRTPKKPILSGSRPELEVTANGIRKMKQSCLNPEVFKAAFRSQEAMGEPSVSSSTPKVNAEDNGFDFQRPAARKLPVEPLSPIHGLENSPDLDETNLSTTAYQRIAEDIKDLPDVKENVLGNMSMDHDGDIKEELVATYDRLPEPAEIPVQNQGCRESRRLNPGHNCLGCRKFYDAYVGDNRQEALYKISRHRSRQYQEPDTPPRFWDPMVTQTPKTPPKF